MPPQNMQSGAPSMPSQSVGPGGAPPSGHPMMPNQPPQGMNPPQPPNMAPPASIQKVGKWGLII